MPWNITQVWNALCGDWLIVGRKGSAGEVTRISGKFWPSDVTYYVLGNKEIDIDFLFYLDSLNEKVQALQKLQEDQLQELEGLKQSVLHQAFQGEL